MRERLRSAALVLLCALVIVLFYVSLSLAGSEGAFVRRLTGAGAATYSAAEQVRLTAAARPEKLALVTDDGVRQAWAAEEFELLWNELQPLYEEAVGSAGAAEPLSESAFDAALRAPSAVLCYATPLPLSLLRAWSDAGSAGEEAEVSSAVLCAGENGMRLLLRDSAGHCCGFDTAADLRRLTELCAAAGSPNAKLAVQDAACSALWAEEPVLTELAPLAVRVPQPVAAADSGELPRSVLADLGMNPYLAKIYQDAAGSTVYVDGRSSLMITDGGDLVYTAGESGVAVEALAGVGEAACVCQTVQRLLNGVWTALSADGTLSLSEMRYEQAEDRYVLRFELEESGHFFDLTDRCWAQATVRGGQVTDVLLMPRRLAVDGEQTMMPLRQAAAALNGAARCRMSVRWRMRDGVLTPVICRVD